MPQIHSPPGRIDWMGALERLGMKKLFKLALLVAVVMIVAKKMCGGMGNWEGMTEADVRNKLDSKLRDRVPDEKREMIADKVVGKMREKGVLTDDAAEASAATEAAAATEAPDASEAAEDTSTG